MCLKTQWLKYADPLLEEMYKVKLDRRWTWDMVDPKKFEICSQRLQQAKSLRKMKGLPNDVFDNENMQNNGSSVRPDAPDAPDQVLDPITSPSTSSQGAKGFNVVQPDAGFAKVIVNQENMTNSNVIASNNSSTLTTPALSLPVAQHATISKSPTLPFSTDSTSIATEESTVFSPIISTESALSADGIPSVYEAVVPSVSANTVQDSTFENVAPITDLNLDQRVTSKRKSDDTDPNPVGPFAAKHGKESDSDLRPEVFIHVFYLLVYNYNKLVLGT